MPLGNCPKYLNKKRIVPDIPQPRLVSESVPLVQAAVDLVAKADMFFISSSNKGLDMDTNHRGGPPGFVRLLSNDERGCVLVYPEYSGNRFYQTLGNLLTKPEAGLAFPDFDTGNILYITGTTEILVQERASRVLPRSNVAVIIRVEAARFVEKGLAFRGVQGEYSPYNPPVRFHVKEQRHVIPDAARPIHADLIDKKILTPTIARFRFHIVDPEESTRWKPGQYVTLSFDKEFSVGYGHMREDDPQSLNDDYVRTFTVLSRPGDASDFSHFEVTIRKVGFVTERLLRHNPRMGLEVSLKGFGGEFTFHQGENEHIGIIAGGIGITPMLAQVQTLDLARAQVYWTIRADDLGLVLDSFERAPSLAASTKLFITGRTDTAAVEESLLKLAASKAEVQTRRMVRGDIQLENAGSEDSTVAARIETWYVCTGPELRKQLLQWLEGRTVVFEDFNY
jgi:NAD(P)H-flavin reductase